MLNGLQTKIWRKNKQTRILSQNPWIFSFELGCGRWRCWLGERRWQPDASSSDRQSYSPKTTTATATTKTTATAKTTTTTSPRVVSTSSCGIVKSCQMPMRKTRSLSLGKSFAAQAARVDWLPQPTCSPGHNWWHCGACSSRCRGGERGRGSGSSSQRCPSICWTYALPPGPMTAPKDPALLICNLSGGK